MVAKKFGKGQAVIETLISSAFLVVIMGAAFNELLTAQQESEKELVSARNIIWNNKFNDELMHKSNDYRLERKLGVIVKPIDQLVNVDLPTRNLWEKHGSNFPMAKLSDGWGARSKEGLSNRPASLVVNNLLSGEVTELFQDGLGSLFLAEELSSDSLVFGTISPDVVPEGVLQKKE